ncbi:MAG TPA: glycosyltransferase family 4 protein [Acidimicrobiales bacterium]|nr:glycosyltransferase family 4 protein [Acidimicrobiales bacterium]
MAGLRVSYVLPKLIDHPVGGYKVHYQYADGLARRGHRVTLVHPVTEGARAGLRAHLACWRARARQRRTSRPPISWFEFDASVRSRIVPTLRADRLPAADVTVLTAWQTAERTPSPPRAAGVVVQVVYDYEFWMTQPERRAAIERALGRSDVAHVATSGVVARMLHEIGVVPVATIPAGLADGEFGLDVPPEHRDRVVGFARRYQPSKDPETARSAIESIHTEAPEATLVCFGDAPDAELPAWVERLGAVSATELRAFYNRCSVFLLTSRVEGWGLPALEAMACGAVVVSTASGGVEDFLTNDENGVVVPVGDATAMAAATVELLGDPARHARLARRGFDVARTMTVARSLDQLEALLVERAADG